MRPLTDSAIDLAFMIRDKQISAVEVVESHHAIIDQLNPPINALVVSTREQAIRDAIKADKDISRGKATGPLHGVPFTVKDALAVRDQPFSGGTLGRVGVIAERDATVVARMRSAGAILLGKTNVPEGCLAIETDNLIYGRTNNPYDFDRTPGGSSGGEAALIAVGGSPIGLGSDAGGSIRQPAHCCGIAGLKPTAGRVPRTGHWPEFTGMTNAFNVVGPMSRSVKDLMPILAVIAGPDGYDPHIAHSSLTGLESVDVRKLRIAWFTDNGVTPADRETVIAVTNAVDALEVIGCSVTEDRPPDIERSFETLFSIWRADAGSGIRALLKECGTVEAHPLTIGFQRMQGNDPKSASELAFLLANLDELRSKMLVWMQRYDAIISPVNARSAVPHGTSINDEVFPINSYVYPYNLAGWPAVSIRGGSSLEGLPIGVQVGAAPWRDDVALAVASVLEEILGGYEPPARRSDS